MHNIYSIDDTMNMCHRTDKSFFLGRAMTVNILQSVRAWNFTPVNDITNAMGCSSGKSVPRLIFDKILVDVYTLILKILIFSFVQKPRKIQQKSENENGVY